MEHRGKPVFLHGHMHNFRTCFALFSDNSLRSAHARRPVCTLRIYTLLGILAPCLQTPCECSHPGTQGLGPGTQEKGPGPSQGPRGPFGPPGGGGAFGALGAHGGHWDDSEAIPNGMLF